MLGLRLCDQVLGLGLEAQVIGIGFELGGQCHECSRPAASSKLLYYRARCEVDTLNYEQRDAVQRMFEMLMWKKHAV